MASVRNSGYYYGTSTLSYTYDDRGNILTISENGVLKVTFTYDKLNQLTREDNVWLNKSIKYVYDLGGNLRIKLEYAYTTGTLGTLVASTPYSYDDTNWKDKLTAYKGNTITYDQIGNPLTYYDGRTFTWEAGRQLASTTKDGLTTSFTYNDNGIRTSKTHNGVTTTYYLNGDSVVREQNATDTIDYYYDEKGDLSEFYLNGVEYYYVRNGQNDIIGILDSSCHPVVSYQYDSWGKLISTTGTLADTVGVKNPYRYRGYRYDIETGFYYLNSRYYDPETGRFINADDTAILEVTQGELLSHNLFAYCGNNPVMNSDPSGYFKIEADLIATTIDVIVTLTGLAALVMASFRKLGAKAAVGIFKKIAPRMIKALERTAMKKALIFGLIEGLTQTLLTVLSLSWGKVAVWLLMKFGPRFGLKYEKYMGRNWWGGKEEKIRFIL